MSEVVYRWGYQHAGSGKWTHGVDRLDDLSSSLSNGFMSKCDDIDATFIFMGVPDPDNVYQQFCDATTDDRADELSAQFGLLCSDWAYTLEGTRAMLSYDRQAAYLEEVSDGE